jgi:sugar phosphate isomerase/epimerase
MEDKGAFSFSTCWNIKRHTDGSEIVHEIKTLGFRRLELNYNVTKELLAAIEPMIEREEIGISSVHNTFPHVPDPDYGTDSVLLGFEEEEKRQRAIELLVGSAEYAQRYGSEAVVVHPGEVPFPNDISKELEQIYNRQGRDSEEFRSKWAELMERRQTYSAGYVQKIIASLDEVCNRAVSKGLNIRFGLETRSKPQQIPTLAEARDYKGFKGGAYRHMV